MTNSFEDQFEFPVLTKCEGKLSFPILKKIKDEIKCNAASVYSELGGGAHGHLGLVLTVTEYAHVSATPYVRSTMPAALNIPLGTTAHESLRLRENHKEEKRLFIEVTDLEKALIKMLSRTIPSMYLMHFRNEFSSAINARIPVILSHLLDTYGRVTEDDLLQAEGLLQARIYDITEPLVVMFNDIDEFQQLATAARLPYSDNQIINLGIRLIKNMNDFEKGLNEWYDLQIKTYLTFKTHFTTAQNNLRRVRGPTMSNGVLAQQVNSITSNIQQTLQEQSSEYLMQVSETKELLLRALEVVTPSTSLAPSDSSQPSTISTITAPSVSNTSQDTVMTEILKVLQRLDNNATSEKRKREDDTLSDSKNKRTFTPRTNLSEYCHSHGACSHSSKDCRTKGNNHKNNATFANKMGGSMRYCQQTK